MKGERRLFHWRDWRGRQPDGLLETPAILIRWLTMTWLLPAITLSLYGEEGRGRLFAAIKRA
jgi:2-dehydro-3-deoxygluconokinase